MLNATNFVSLVRRSQAAVFAVIPDQGNGEGSVNSTFTVSPILNESRLPTALQFCGGRRTSGASTNPITGTPARSVMALPAAAVTNTKNFRRLTSGSTDDPLPGLL